MFKKIKADVKPEELSYTTKAGNDITINKFGGVYVNGRSVTDNLNDKSPSFEVFCRITFTDGQWLKVTSKCTGCPRDSSSLINVWSTLGDLIHWYYKSTKPAFTVFANNVSHVIKRVDIRSIEYGYSDKDRAVEAYKWYKKCQEYKSIKGSKKYKELICQES